MPSLSTLALTLAAALTLPMVADAAAPRVTVSVLVPGQSHGVIVRRPNGIDWNPADGHLYATSTTSEAIYRIDVATGDVTLAVAPPWGEGDDIAFAPDGSMAWTAIVTGELRYKRPNGPVQVLDKTVPGINPVAFRKDGRLVAAQANQGHALYEYDPRGGKPRRVILQDMADLNSFGFGPDGLLYSPQRPYKTVSIDIDSGTLRVLSEETGGSAKVDANGQVVTISKDDTLIRLDPRTGARTNIAPVTGGFDGLAIGPDGTIYGSSPSESSIFAFDPATGAKRDVVRGHFSSLGGLAIGAAEGHEILLAADAWGFRNVDPVTGAVEKVPSRGLRSGGSSDIAVRDNTIALANVRLGVVQKVDRATEKVVYETKDIKMPYGVALLDDGSVAVADFTAKRIARVDGAGPTTLAQGFAGPVGLARDGDGLLVTDALAGTLTRIDLHTGRKSVLLRGLREPEGLAIMRDGRIAIAEPGAGRLIAFDPRTKARQVLAARLPFGAHVTQTAARVGLPAGVAVGADGAVYVSCDGDFSIRKVTMAR